MGDIREIFSLISFTQALMLSSQVDIKEMVPVEGIEPPTFGLQNRCSTAELRRQGVAEKYQRN